MADVNLPQSSSSVQSSQSYLPSQTAELGMQSLVKRQEKYSSGQEVFLSL